MPFQPAIDEPSNILPSSKKVCVDDVRGNGDVLLLAARVGEAQVDELDLLFLDQLEDISGRRHEFSSGMAAKLMITGRSPLRCRCAY